MNEPMLSAADRQILEQQQALRKKTGLIAIVSIAILAAIALVYVVSQNAVSNSNASVAQGDDVQTDVVTLSNSDIEQYRDEFRQVLAEFDESSQHILENEDITLWQPKRVQSLVQKKQQAIKEFAQSSFKTATTTLLALSEEIAVLQQDWQDAYQQKIKASKAFLDEDKINQARLAFSEAIAIFPQNPDGQDLAIKLTAYEKVNEVRLALKIAQVENNLNEQIALLEQLTALDASLVDEKRTLQALKMKRADIQHSDIVVQANQAIDKGKLDKAQQLVVQVRDLKPNNEATKTLVQRLAKAQKLSLLQTHLSEVEKAADQQNWQRVALKAQEYQALHPAQAKFATLFAKARDILNAQKQINVFINKPQRLADNNVRQAAIRRLQEALSLAAYSDSLASQLGELGKLIDNYSSAIPVTINSDEESYILVLGVGHVGAVSQHQIDLTPGRYTLEARKQGYKTKRLNIEVIEGKRNHFFIANDEKI